MVVLRSLTFNAIPDATECIIQSVTQPLNQVMGPELAATDYLDQRQRPPVTQPLLANCYQLVIEPTIDQPILTIENCCYTDD